jgi:ubiquinone/menaquinone biosynthesis C-methylase UbiE
MESRLFRRIQRYGWDAATAAYDEGWVPRLDPLTRACVARAALAPGARVLDLATGPGGAAFAAADVVGPEGRVIGIDISDRMVALAAARAAERGRPHVSFRRGELEDTGAPTASFDAALCAFGLMFAADRGAAFAELARVLAPSGRVSLCVWGRRSHCGWAEVFPIIDRRVHSEVCPLFFALGVPGALAHALAAAGFEDIEEERVSVTLLWGSAQEACETMLEGGAVALAWSRFSEATRAEVRAEYLASLEPFRHGERYGVPAEIVFATARKRRA